MRLKSDLAVGLGRHGFLAIVGILLLSVSTAPPLLASDIPLGDAANYAVLYEGTGGHNLSITNVTVNGNVGVGGTGAVHFSGPGNISGALDFSAANTGQFTTAPGNTGPTSVNYNVSNVTSALGTINTLSSSLAAAMGASLSISGTETVDESLGTLDVINGVSYYVFNVTSYTEGNGNLLTIDNNTGTSDPVVFNFLFNSNVNLGGDVALSGLTTDQVLWNFGTSGKNVSLNNNASSFPLPLAFMGIILAPNDVLSITNANLDGRFFGGDSGDMQIVSGTTINAPPAPPSVPEPMTLVLFGSGLAMLLVKKGLGRA